MSESQQKVLHSMKTWKQNTGREGRGGEGRGEGREGRGGEVLKHLVTWSLSPSLSVLLGIHKLEGNTKEVILRKMS